MERWLETERNVRVCALLGALAIAFSSILVRLSHASPSTAAIFRCAYALPLLGLFAWVEDRRHGRRTWASRRVAIAAGLFFAVDLILWHHSIRDVGAGSRRCSPTCRSCSSRWWPGSCSRSGPDGACWPRCRSRCWGFPDLGRARARRIRPQPDARRDLRARRRHRVRRIPAPAAPRRSGSASAGGSAVRRHRDGGGRMRYRRVLIGDADLAPDWPGAAWPATLALTSQVLGWPLITISLPRLWPRTHLAAADGRAHRRGGACGADLQRIARRVAAARRRAGAARADHRDPLSGDRRGLG